MAKDIQDRVGQILGSDGARALAGTAVSEALKAIGSQASSSNRNNGHRSTAGLSGVRGLAAGAGAAAMAPMAVKGIGKLIKANGAGGLAAGPKKLAEGAASKLGDSVGDKVGGKVDEAGGPSGILKDTVKSALPFGGGGGPKNDAQGVGKGRRMPIQQSVDIGLPIETVYNQWTQFAEWPKFMHRVTRVSQEDPCKVSFTTKIWGKSKEFTAEIDTQRPNERIRWKTTEGMNHTGLVTFHELGPSLTRVLLGFDVDPGSLIEKYARGARYVKRAARADLHRFKAFIEMLEHETGAWRGVIEDGELVKDHPASYDKKREYGSAEELLGSDEDQDDEDEDDESHGRNGGDPGQRQRRRSSSSAQRRSSSRSARSSGSRSSSGGNSGSRSSSSGSSSRSSSGRSSGSSGGSRSSSRSGASGSRRTSGRSTGGSGGGTRSSGGKRTQGRSRSSGSSADQQGRQRSRSSRRS